MRPTEAKRFEVIDKHTSAWITAVVASWIG